ncbi:hypothetical protein ABPG73_006702 [Tetrahymena malaccensis]
MDQEDIDFSDIEKFLLTHYRKCPIHKRSITYLRLDDKEDPQLIKCFKCMEENKSNNCIDIVELLQSDNHFIFQKWPIHDDDTILKDLQQMKQWPFAQYCEEINLIFDEIIEKVQSKRKEILKDLGQIQENQQKPLDYYKQISQKEKLVNIIKNQFADQKEQNQMILSVIKENEQNYGSNKKQLVDLINEANKHLFDLIEIKNIMDKVLSSINQINRFDNQQDFDGKPVDNNDQNLEEITIYSFVDLNQCWDFQKINFDFSRYDLQFDSLEELKDELNYCQNIVELQLNLQQTSINNEAIKNIVEGLFNHQNIKKLQLGLESNKIELIGAMHFANLIEIIQNLTYLDLDLRENLISSEAVQSIAKAIQSNRNMTHLELGFSQNNIGREGAMYIGNALSQLQNLNTLFLYLNNCHILDEGAIRKVTQPKELLVKKLAMQEINYVNSDDEILSQSCPIHKRKVLYLVLDDKNDPNVLKCIKCFEQQKPLCSILIEDLLQSDDSTIFRNWPFLEGRVTYKKLKQIDEISKWFMDQKEKTVEDLFTDFKSAVIQKIDTIKKDTLKKLDSINQIKQEAIDLYNQMSFKKELKKILRTRAIGEDEDSLDKQIFIKNLEDLKQCLNYKNINIDFNNNKIQDEGLISLTKSIQNCQNISNLEITKKLTMQEINYVNSDDEILSQSCPIHKRKVAYLVLDDTNDPNVLKCIKCFEQQKPLCSILIEDLLQSDDSTIFRNWPFLEDRVTYKQLKYLDEISKWFMDQKEKTVEDLFTDFKSAVIQKIDTIKKDTLKKLDSINQIKQKTIDLYNQMSFKEELKKILRIRALGEDEVKIKNAKILNIINENMQKYQQNYQELSIQIDNAIQYNFNLTLYHNKTKEALSQIDQIDFFQDSLDKEIHIKNLEDLKYEKNLNDSDIKTIGEVLKDCNEITTLQLHLSNNKIGLKGVETLANTLELFQNINELQLSLNDIHVGDEGAVSITNAISQHKDIYYLHFNLRNCQINSLGVKVLVKSIENYRKLRYLGLNLCNNNIGIEGTDYIAKGLKKQQNLTHLVLWLDSNKLGDEGVSKISNAIIQYQNITVLQLSFADNNVSNKGVQQLAQALQNFKKLTELQIYLENNKFQDEGLVYLAKSLQNYQNISILKLVLSSNKIGDEGISKISNAITQYQNIRQLQLYFDDNDVSSKGVQQLAQALQNFKKLTILIIDLDNNKIQDEGLISLTKSIQNCQNISNLEISLGANQTSQPGAQYFADILYKFEKLTQLTLYFDYDQIGVEGALSIINNLEKINSIKKFVFALSYRSSVFWVIKMLEFIINKVTLGLEEDVEIMVMIYLNDDNFNKSNEDNDDFLNNVNQDGYDEEINYHDQDYDNTLCNIILKTKILIKFDFYWDQQSEYYY